MMFALQEDTARCPTEKYFYFRVMQVRRNLQYYFETML